MGYYATIKFRDENVKFKKDIKELNKEIQKKFDGTSFMDVYLESDEKNPRKLKWIEKTNLTEKYREDYYPFTEFLSNNMEEGMIILGFTGEDGEQWGFVVFPGLVLEFNGTDDLNGIAIDNIMESKKYQEAIRNNSEAIKYILPLIEQRKEEMEKIIKEYQEFLDNIS